MVTATNPIRHIQVVEQPVLESFCKDFGTQEDLSRYENIRIGQRAILPCVAYLNQLQMDAYLPARQTLLLKNNLHDQPFVTYTTRSILYELRQQNKMGEECFQFLHAKLNEADFATVFKYLYILMLYSNIAREHDTQNPDPRFHFLSVDHFSERLIKSSLHAVVKEEAKLQKQWRIHFLTKKLLEIASRTDYPAAARSEIFSVIGALNEPDPALFRCRFLNFLKEMQQAPELEKMCWKELHEQLIPFKDADFFEQVYLRLKTESYYKNCLSRVTLLRQSLERTDTGVLVDLAEKCKKAYNGCVYLLGDNKSMPASSSLRFAALTGKIRNEWQLINNVFNRAQNHYRHHFCSCGVQLPASQNELADWPFNSHSLVPLKPAQPTTPDELRNRGVDLTAFQENQKKTVAIIGCRWGGGHMQTTRAIADTLAYRGYHPVTVDMPEILMSLDPVRNNFITKWLGQSWTTGTLFDGLLREKAFALINFLRWLGQKLSPITNQVNETELKPVLEHLLKVAPDSVITTYNAHNEPIIQACKILGIPCIHISTDIHNEIETRNIPPNYDHFKMSLPFAVRECTDPIQNTVRSDQQFISGPIVRQAFTRHRTEADIRSLKQAWGIDINKKVVIVSNGKTGAFSPYPEILAQKYAHTPSDEIPIHLVVLSGSDNISFQNHLTQRVVPHTKLPISIYPFVPEEKMAELMAMASYGGVLVGKAGGSTTFESIQLGTRILVDNVRSGMLSEGVLHFFVSGLEVILRKIGFRGQLPWEEINKEFGKKHGFSSEFQREEDFLGKLDELLNNNGLPVRSTLELKNFANELPRTLLSMQAQADAAPDTRTSRQIYHQL